MIELCVFPPSPRAFKVMAIANHLGIETTLRFVDLVKGDQKAPEYATLNPNMRMPTLKDGDYVLWESAAIAQYLAGKRPESGLLPKDERARLDVTRWQFWDVAHWDPACAVFLFENVVKSVVLKSGDPDPVALAKGGENFDRAAGAQTGGGLGMTVSVLTGDCREVLRTLPDESVHCVVTSPPYWGLRDYGVAGQLGLEPSLAEHVETMRSVFAEVRRVLRSDGTLWLNYGDSYATAPNGRSAADTKLAGSRLTCRCCNRPSSNS